MILTDEELHAADPCPHVMFDQQRLEYGRAIERAVASAVAKRCADLCQQSDEDGEGPDCWGWHSKDYADAIRREFPEVSQ